MIILALDALDLKQIQRFNCKNLMQNEYGQTSISESNQERTVVLWASFARADFYNLIGRLAGN